MSDVTLNRNKFIGGSDVAAILGINRYKTVYEVWEEKKHGIVTFEGNNITDWGKKLEPVILREFELKHNVKIFDNNAKYISKEYKELGCHPDGIAFIKENCLIEAKTVSTQAFKHWGNELPLEYYCQVQHNLFVCNLNKAYFIYFVLDDRNYSEIEITRDNDFIQKQNDYLCDWWNRYIIGDEVPIKVVQDYEKESPDQQIIEANDDILKVFDSLVIAKEKFNKAKEEKEALEDKLKEFIGSNTDLHSGLQTLATWRTQVRVQMDTKKFKEEMPETYLKYCKDNKVRVFLTKI